MVEAMVVVSMIGLITAAIAPTMSEMMVDGRQSAAAVHLVGLGRKTRDSARELGFAHRLDFSAAASSTLGAITTQIAMTGSCIRSGGWTATMGTLRMHEFSPALSTGRTRLTLRAQYAAPNAANLSTVDTLSICYEPDGETFTATAGGVFVRQPGSALFRIQREIGGSTAAADPFYRRDILFPSGGSARAR
jgi:type II secretory pathway pseudopilin PulG